MEVITRLAVWLRSRHAVLWRARLGPGARALGRIWVHGGGTVVIGAGATVDGRAAPIELHAEPGAEIVIGERAVVEGGTSIEALARVSIGPAARLGPHCKILDNDFHELSGDRTRRPPSSPVEVGEGAVLGERVILLPGAKVGPRKALASGAVVRGLPSAPASRLPSPLPGAAAPPPVAPDLDPGHREMAVGNLRRAARLVRSEPRMALKVAWWLFRAHLVLRPAERGSRVRVRGRLWGGPRVIRGGRLSVGDRTTFVHGMIPTVLATRPGGTLTIGRSCVLNYGCVLDASSSVRIGERCMLGQLVTLRDRTETGTGPIVIGDDVWLAHGVTVCPGVTIGNNVVVSAGSVVTRDIPSDSFAAGNPARAVRMALVTPLRDSAQAN